MDSRGRLDGRAADEPRPCSIEAGFVELHPASCLIKTGRTWVLCTATAEERVPPFLEGTGRGWVTGEYGMLPGCGPGRIPPARNQGGRAEEISRLLGRALRAAVDLTALGPRMVTVDAQVIQADGGTRTASITGGYVALALALAELRRAGLIETDPLKRQIAAISVGLVGGELLLDLNYQEDARADADLNVVMAADGGLVEVQGTAEGELYTRAQLGQLLDLADLGIRPLVGRQREAIAGR
jgi:ribonuclease PH